VSDGIIDLAFRLIVFFHEKRKAKVGPDNATRITLKQELVRTRGI